MSRAGKTTPGRSFAPRVTLGRTGKAGRTAAIALWVVACLAASGCRRQADAPAPAAPTSPAGDAAYDSALSQGDQAFANREDPTRLSEAVTAYRRAAELRPREPEIELRLARAEAFCGLADDDRPSGREAWLASARAAERALRRLSPGFAEAVDRGDDPAVAAAAVTAAGAEPLYLLAQGQMRAAQLTGYAAVLAVKDAALAMMARAAELDERVDAAGPLRALGAWRAALPVAAGGGATAAKALFDRARTAYPTDLLARVAEAETLAVLLQDRARFDALLAEVDQFDLASDPARAPENRIAKRRGSELAQRRSRLF